MILTPLFQQQTITIFLGTNPAQVGWRSITKDILKSIAKDIQSLSSQSECTFNDIHCFIIHLCHLKHAYLSVEDTKWLMVGGVLNIRSTDLHPSSGSQPLCFLIWSNKQLHHFHQYFSCSKVNSTCQSISNQPISMHLTVFWCHSFFWLFYVPPFDP